MNRIPLKLFVAAWLLSAFACSRQITPLPDSTMLEEAKVLVSQSKFMKDGGPATTSQRHSSKKEIIWAKSKKIELSVGEALAVPVLYKDIAAVQNAFGDTTFQMPESLSHLLFYRGSDHKIKGEFVTIFRGKTKTASAKVAVVENLNFQPLKMFLDASGEIKRYADTASLAPSSTLQICYTSSGYNFSPDHPNQSYYWTENLGCSYFYFPDINGANSQDASGQDYFDSGGGGGGGAGGESYSPLFAVLSANGIIGNIQDYVKCFSNIAGSGTTYKVTLCVDQAEPGTRETWGMTGGLAPNGLPISVGHSWLVFEQVKPSGTIRRNVGFYPKSGVHPLSPSDQGQLGNDESREFDVALELTLDNSQFFTILEQAKIGSDPGYTFNLNTNNCTSFVLAALRASNIYLPSTTGSWLHGSGNNPGDLGEDIRTMQLASNMRRIVGNTFHGNLGTCY